MTDQQPPQDGKDEGGAPEEPEATGTVFLMVLFLMATVGLWVIMYLKLIGR